MPMNLSATQAIIVLVIAAVIFGSRRLPGIGRGLGEGLREFGRGIRGLGPSDGASAAASSEVTDRRE